MSTKTDMRITISKKQGSSFLMSEVNPETSPSKYRALLEMAAAGEIEILCKSKPRRLWEMKATNNLVVPKAHVVKGTPFLLGEYW